MQAPALHLSLHLHDPCADSPLRAASAQHSVTAPHAAAGARPRYSLVLKLVLHPPEGSEGDVPVRLADVGWGEPTPFGSAAIC